jgi:hypothetical protein
LYYMIEQSLGQDSMKYTIESETKKEKGQPGWLTFCFDNQFVSRP